MASQEFELAFYGELIAGAALDDCKQKLAQLFKASPAQLEKMFSGKRVVLKSKLDQATGDKYLAALTARGAACKLELVGQSDAPAPAPAERETAPASFGSVEESNDGDSPAFGNTEQNERMSLAGEVADQVLENSRLSIDPVGVRLSDAVKDVEAPALDTLANIDLAPAGSDLVDPVDEVPVAVPDISHLSIKD